MLDLIATRRPTRPRIRLAFAGISLILAATACGSARQSPESNAKVPDGPLVQQLTGAVSDARAMDHLQALQKIADQHGGNRASGTPGYEASQIGPAITRMSAASTRPNSSGHASTSQPRSRMSGYTPV